MTEILDDAQPAPKPSGSPFLQVKDLKIHFPTDDGLVKSVDGLSFSLERGKTLGIVGESGSGKSVSSLGIMGLHHGTSARVSGEIWLDGDELVSATPDFVRRLRGRKMAMIFQDPLSSMHPFYKVGSQIVEAYRLYNDVSKKQARQHAIDLLGRVGIPEPAKRVDAYPHQFSGGMRQRAMIAMALACDPELLIADEPTTALDVTVQAEVLDLLRDLQEEFHMGVLLVTHNFGVVADLCDRVSVMRNGRIVETGPARAIFADPQHEYTRALFDAILEDSKPRSALAVSGARAGAHVGADEGATR